MLKLMKELVLGSAVILTFFIIGEAYAAEEVEQEQGSRDYREVRSEILKNIDARLESLKKHRECVSSTKDQDGLRSCMDSHREEMMKLRPNRPMDGRRGGMRGNREGRMGPGGE
ncbi:MAG: hypothetical protein RQ824_03595 [bacterium]|nr:hypothetical protein [bacterium]